jgi:hypothetical protein
MKATNPFLPRDDALSTNQCHVATSLSPSKVI